jgi:serine/threonine protein kinase
MASVDPDSLFEIGAELGYGTYGKVFAGKGKKSGEIVAIKIIAISEDKHMLKQEVDIMKRTLYLFVCV